MTDERLARIGRLLALARGLERDGGYNGAKLVRAVLEREQVRYAASQALVGAEAVGGALAALRDELAGEDEPAVLERLTAVERAARSGSTLSLEEAPPVRTCRTCGELFLGEPVPAACPVCEAAALSFQEHLPIWFLAPAEPATILDALAHSNDRLASALAATSDDALARPPAAGEWSARDTLEHLLFAEQLLAERLERLLTEAEPDLSARAVWADTPTSDEGRTQTGEPASELFTRVAALRRETVTRLRGLDAADWQRSGRHGEWGRVTVLGQAAYFARHEASHHAQLFAAAEGRLPGTG